MGQGERRYGVILAAVVAVALLAAPATASAAKNCSEKVERYEYEVTAAGHNGGLTTLDGEFSHSSRVDFSYGYDAVLRVCESIGAIRMDKGAPERARAAHRGEFVRNLDTGARCSWDETLDAIVGPLRVRGHDFARAQGVSGSDWALVMSQGIGFNDELLRDAYTQVLRGEHETACGENVPLVTTLGPDSMVFGALTAHSPDFFWPGIVIEGQGRRNPPPILRKLLAGKNAKVAGPVDYPNHPSGSFVEHGTWLVSLEFKRQGR